MDITLRYITGGLIGDVTDEGIQSNARPGAGSCAGCVASGSGAAVLVTSGHLDETVEDGELELELGAVDECFVGGLVLILVGVLEAKDGDVEKDDEDVDVDEVVHETSASTLVAHCAFHAHQLDGLDDVEARDDDLLDEEDGNLDLLHNGVRLPPLGSVTRERAINHRNDRPVHENSIDADHIQHSLQAEPIPQHEMQPRPQHERLARHHSDPAKGDERSSDIAHSGRGVVLDEKAAVVDADAPGGDEEGPEVEARVSLEGAEDDKGQFNDVVERDGEEDQDDGYCQLGYAIEARAEAFVGHVEKGMTRGEFALTAT
ncbi:hypothetical protein HG530_014371 [Fusarium avenaceum]|nr:hypothetical protein HG530_014371 [Fusarium avenaceum]